MQTKELTWGKLIKFYRQAQKLTQDDLAVGICTPSYLSRIENGVVIAEQSLYAQLLEQLGINLTVEQQTQQQNIVLLEVLYEKFLSNEPLTGEEIIKLEALQTTKLHFQEDAIIAKLIYSRYLLSLKQDIQGRQLLQELAQVITWKIDRITQLYVAITAFAHLSFLEFGELVRREEQQQLDQYLTTASPFEQANYQYHLAFASHRNYNFQQALVHIEKASAIFSHQFKPLFQLKLYSMKGVIFNDLNRFNEALLEFNAGLDLLTHVTTIQSPMQWSSIHNNIAYCYECHNQFDKALQHYAIANEYEEDLLSAINWMRTCFQHGDLKKLQQLLTQYPEDCFSVQHHRYQRQLLHYMCNDDITIASLKQLEEEVFPYFYEQGYYSLTLYYAPLWAVFYEKLHAYKHAAACYKEAFNASEKVRQRMSC